MGVSLPTLGSPQEVLCKCGNNPATEPHQCPFKIEIQGDSSLCTCCEECESVCRMEV
jgi:hypothetical protein